MVVDGCVMWYKNLPGGKFLYHVILHKMPYNTDVNIVNDKNIIFLYNNMIYITYYKLNNNKQILEISNII